MINLHKVAGNVMEYMEAFDGSRPALDAEQILIVRGRSKKRIDANNMNLELESLFKVLGAKEIDMFSDDAASLITLMDKQIRDSVEIQGDTDPGGIHKMKESLESMNFLVEYKLGFLENIGFFIVLWKDKSGIGPCFVEIVFSNAEC
ncbi:DUF2120 domain-containing protein [Methanobacterium alkalithermotolerans]|uniref:DUF2120 domain-containing protein n=1 Tax=Methanobacterium alkalithermotolerans TaxID=2731220 RepID=A0A8T8K6R5_9EURY|nr:DUF2120 domain-containing protein [Methanobacterium alkalithermotolerans]QUH23195.1 DUF2120 domain-containing protein [Methanobacterium alkalithermotolerans]RJS49191.1 MAG: hypothetical protein CIT03_04220 [Methanobacterium sp.]